MSHVVSVFDGSNVWQQNFVWADTPDSVEMLEQADVLDHDSDGNTTEATRSFYHRNALGSVMEITDANEAKVASYRYDPYGNMTITRGGVTQTTDPLGQHWGFTGRFQDEESGLWYYRARYYDSERGRFMQRDPLGFREGPNPLEYAMSNPVAITDPHGLAPLPVVSSSRNATSWKRQGKTGIFRRMRFHTSNRQGGLWVKQVIDVRGVVWNRGGDTKKVEIRAVEYFELNAAGQPMQFDKHENEWAGWCGGNIVVWATLTVGTLHDKKKEEKIKGEGYVLGSANTTMRDDRGVKLKEQGDEIVFKADEKFGRVEYRYGITWDYCNTPGDPPPHAPPPGGPTTPRGEWRPAPTTTEGGGQGRRTVAGPAPWRPIPRKPWKSK